METKFLVIKDKLLLTAAEGQRVAEKLAQLIEALGDPGLVAVQLAETHAATVSALHPICNLARRIQSGEFGDKFLIFKLDGGQPLDELSSALDALGLVGLILDESGRPTPIGRTTKVNSDTWDYVLKNGPTTAAQLTEALGLSSLQTASNRLDRLHKMGLLVKARDPATNRYAFRVPVLEES